MELVNVSICLSDIPKESMKQGNTNGKWYINLVVAKMKKMSQYGDTHTVYVQRSKEERENQTPIVYVGAGKEIVFKTEVKTEATPVSVSNGPGDDLPF